MNVSGKSRPFNMTMGIQWLSPLTYLILGRGQQVLYKVNTLLVSFSLFPIFTC